MSQHRPHRCTAHGLSGRAMPAGKCDCTPMPASTAWRAVPCGRAGGRPAAGRMLPKLVDVIRAVHMLCRAVLAGWPIDHTDTNWPQGNAFQNSHARKGHIYNHHREQARLCVTLSGPRGSIALATHGQIEAQKYDTHHPASQHPERFSRQARGVASPGHTGTAAAT